jgi:hypothetical protein
MKNRIQVRTRVPAKITSAPEHTPIYDLVAYEQQQKKLKFAKIRKKLFESFSFCICVLLTFSMLYLGE